MIRRARSALGLAFALGALGCRGPHAPATQEPPEDEIWLAPEADKVAEVLVVQELNLPQAVRVGGKFAFDDLRVSHVFTPVTGRVTQVHVQPGQKVKKGAALVTIASPDVGSAFSDVVKAQADLAAAGREYHRQQQLLAAEAGTQRDLETAEDNYRKARAELERARQKAQLLRSDSVNSVSQEYTLRSYIDGEVISRNVNLGMEVQGLYSAGSSVELFTVGDTDQVWVYADVPEADLPRVKLGANVAIQVAAYPDRAFEGKVDWIATTVDPALRTTRIRCTLPNGSGELLPEMFASVSIEAEPRRALAVHRDAITSINGETFVYLSLGRRPDGRRICRRKKIHVIDVEDQFFLEVTEGLNAGDEVVVEGSVARERGNDEVRLTSAQMTAAQIELAEIGVREVEDAVTLGGRLAFDDLRVTHIYPPVTGRVTRVLAQPGQRVSKGAPLVTIDSPDLGIALSDVLKAQADLTATAREHQRQKELYEAHAGALKDLEAAENAFKKAKAEFERAQQKKMLLRAGDVGSSGQEYTLRSPIAGEVVARNVNPGMEVQGQYSGAGQAVELFTIGEIDKLLVLGDVYEMDLPHVREGAPVTMRLSAYPSTVFRGTAEWVSNVLDPQLRTAKVRCTLDNPDHLLKPEMYEVVTVSIPAKQFLAVPRAAVLRQGPETIVFVAAGVAEDGRARFKRRSVKVGEERPNGLVPIAGGLKPEDKEVVANGAIFLLGLL